VTELFLGQGLILFAAGIAGGTANAVAGGGTFFTLPALLATGLDPIVANASNAVAIFPGHAMAIPRRKAEVFGPQDSVVTIAVVAAAGGICGAVLLLWAGSRIFQALIPVLLLLATALFAFAPRIAALSATAGPRLRAARMAVLFVTAVYGGFFGAGLGILLTAVLTIMGETDLRRANAQKNVLATLIATMSILIFSGLGIVAWPQVVWVMSGAILGGHFGGRFAQRVPVRYFRGLVVVIGLLLSAHYAFG
jgi:uncharacterized protein